MGQVTHLGAFAPFVYLTPVCWFGNVLLLFQTPAIESISYITHVLKIVAPDVHYV